MVKLKKLPHLLSPYLLIITLAIVTIGCRQPASGNDNPKALLTYHYYNSYTEEERVDFGVPIKNSKLFQKGYKSDFYDFEGWYLDYSLKEKSKINEKFIVRENTDLFLNIVPKLKSATISDSNTVIVDLLNNDYNDVDFNSFKIICYSNKTNIPQKVTITNTYYDKQLNKYFINFQTPQYVNNEGYFLVVSNGVNEISLKGSKNPIVGAIPTPINVQVQSLGSGIYDISWDFISSDFKYRISYNLPNSLSKVCGETDDNHFRFVTHETSDLTFKVQSLLKTDENKISDYSDPVTVPFSKEKVKTLMLMYLDGDNNLTPAIWCDLSVEVEKGLKEANSNDIEVIALWDGANQEKGDSRLYKMGADNGEKDFLLSDNTIDITNSMNNSVWNVVDGNVEVNMASSETLKALLQWAQEHYEYNNIILQFSNHGGGPRSNKTSRSMCEDITNTDVNHIRLFTKDIPNVLRELKMNVDLIIEDVCLGASIEETYEFKNLAKYMLLSPNTLPGIGLDYVSVIGHMKEGDCSINGQINFEKLLNCIIEDFSKNPLYDISKEQWEDYRNKVKQDYGPEFDFTTPYGKKILAFYSTKNSTTLSAINVNKLDNLKNKINDFAQFAIANKDNTYTNNKKTKSYKELLAYPFFNVAPYYPTELRDIGFLCDYILDLPTNELNIDEKTKFMQLQQKVSYILPALDDAVISCFRVGYQEPIYSKINGKKNCTLKNGSYGLTICGLFFNNHNVPYFKPASSYKDVLSFGSETQWFNLLETIISAYTY